MRFTADGPSIPDDLLVARDAGDVVFFCGAGVSQHEAQLPNFEDLSASVIGILGSSLQSPARKLLRAAKAMDRIAGVGGMLATDRIFSLLEREFEVADLRSAIAEAIRPKPTYGLGAHRILLDLATSRTGVTRLVTTNFDLLFEECNRTLESWGPPQLPDPRSTRDFHGIIHLHGRVDSEYRRARDDEFVISSADFGRAYLSDGWATRFIQTLLARFQIVFVGYSADDPPVQYLLEALNLQAGSSKRLYAFQEGDGGAASALWEHRGVQAIPFDGSDDFSQLWDTLRAWAERARDIDGWHKRLLEKAARGPAELDPHVRGQIAHIASTREGARRIASATEPLDARWLLVLDPDQRYASPGLAYEEGGVRFDPFGSLSLDDDIVPEPIDPNNFLDQRKVPEGALDLLKPARLDFEEVRGVSAGVLRGHSAGWPSVLPPRLANLGFWIQRIAHQPIALWWAAGQQNLHPSIRRQIEHVLQGESERFPKDIRRDWRLLFAAWDDARKEPDFLALEIGVRARQEGWTPSLVRALATLYRPQLKVKQNFGVAHPLLWNGNTPENVVYADVEYPRASHAPSLPDDWLSYEIVQFRQNLELGVALEEEIFGEVRPLLETTRNDDGDSELSEDAYGITGSVIHLQKLVRRLADVDRAAVLDEIANWPKNDEQIFARLLIWASSAKILTATEVAQIFLGFPDTVFWGSLHERDLLYALRDRWSDFEDDARDALETRLRGGAYPWPEQVRGGVEGAAAFQRLSRLYWLSRAGVNFGFDVDAEISALRRLVPNWTERDGNEAAISHSLEVYTVESDARVDPIRDTPIPDILSVARQAARFSISERVQREPFRGLIDVKPVRALAALTHAARNGGTAEREWADFLHGDGRATDSVRMVCVIAARLERLPLNELRPIIYRVSEWMERIAERLYGDAAEVLPNLWNKVIEILALDDQKRRRRKHESWADQALNAPVGRLVDLLMKDPAKDGRAPGAGYPAYWTARIEQLLELPGDLRRQALVLISYRLGWLYTIAPLWTEHQLLPASELTDRDANAFWDGVFWSGGLSTRELLIRLRPQLLSLAREPRLHLRHGASLAATLLRGWGGASVVAEPERLITDQELREVLINADDELRGQILLQVRQWSSRPDGPWRERIVPFLFHVWPKQRALRTPQMSTRLVELALASGDLLPKVVELLLPRLVPIRSQFIHAFSLGEIGGDHPARRYPTAMLDLLWAVLPEDTRHWPYKIEDILDFLGTVPETGADARLSELRRRREQ